MTKRLWAPSAKARLAGAFEVLEGAGSAGGQEAIRGSLVVAGNAAATATHILGHQQLFLLGFASSLIAVPCHLVWAYLFYQLFKPVNKSIASLATFIILVGCAVQAVATLLYLAPLLTLKGGTAMDAFSLQQIRALALVFLNLNAQAFDVYLVFFGFWCILIGYLVFRSTFLPRIIGVLLTIDGVGWALYLVPPLAGRLFPLIAVASALAELPLMLWLLVVGVNDERWTEQAAAAGDSLRT
jgi:hypothetical protein